MPKPKDIDQFCRTHLSPYAHKDSVKNDIAAVLKNFAEVDVSKGQFYESNGHCRDLVKLHGTIPVHFKGNVYHIPVCLWLDHQHPYRAPICLVEPTSTMHVKPGKHVDSSGVVYLPYLHEWRHPNSDILNLIQVMQLQFGDECPVFSRPVGAPPPRQPSRPPPPRTAQPSYPPHGAAYQAPAVGGYPGSTPAPGYSSMPRPGQPQPYGGARGPQPPYPSQASAGYPSRQPYPAGSNSSPYPTGPSPYPNSTPYPGAGPPRQPQPGYPTGAAPYPGGPGAGQPPYPGSQPGYPGGGGGNSGPGFPGTGGPQPPYPGASVSNSPYPSGSGPSNPYTTYPPPGQATPGTGTTSSNSSHHNSIMSTTPAGYGAAMVTEQPRGNNDDDGSEDIRRRSLVSGVEDKLRRRLQATIDTAEIETRELQQQQSDLRAGAERLDRVMNQLQSLKTEAESNIAVMTTKSAELQDVLEKLDESSGMQLDVDDAVVATYPLYTQMVTLIAEDNAIEDTVYYLGEALRKKVMPLDVFLRHVRELSTRQYNVRATLQKAQGVAEL